MKFVVGTSSPILKFGEVYVDENSKQPLDGIITGE